MRKKFFIALSIALFVQIIAGLQAESGQTATVTVPDLSWKTYEAAAAELANVGLACEKSVITAIQSAYLGKDGKVVRQSPRAGAKLTKGSKVIVYVYAPASGAHGKVIQPRIPSSAVSYVDLTWDDQFFFNGALSDGTAPTVIAKIINKGKGVLPLPEGVKLEWQVILTGEDGKELYRKTEGTDTPLKGGESWTINFALIPLSAYNATYEIELVADPGNRIDEADKSNNRVKKRCLPDLKVTEMWIEDAGHYYKVCADFNNVGTRHMPGDFGYSWCVDGVLKFSNTLREEGYRPKCTWPIAKSDLPADKKSLLVKLHLNDGQNGMHGKIYPEMDFNNNILEVELKLPDRNPTVSQK